MNDESLDPFESELAGLRPRSLARATETTIAERLAPRWTWRHGAITASAAAAAGIAVLLAWPKPAPPEVKPDGHVSKNEPAKTAAPATFAAYRHAVAESPAALDQMLSRHAALSLHEPREELNAGRRLDGHFLDSLGDH